MRAQRSAVERQGRGAPARRPGRTGRLQGADFGAPLTICDAPCLDHRERRGEPARRDRPTAPSAAKSAKAELFKLFSSPLSPFLWPKAVKPSDPARSAVSATPGGLLHLGHSAAPAPPLSIQSRSVLQWCSEALLVGRYTAVAAERRDALFVTVFKLPNIALDCAPTWAYLPAPFGCHHCGEAGGGWAVGVRAGVRRRAGVRGRAGVRAASTRSPSSIARGGVCHSEAIADDQCGTSAHGGLAPRPRAITAAVP